MAAIYVDLHTQSMLARVSISGEQTVICSLYDSRTGLDRLATLSLARADVVELLNALARGLELLDENPPVPPL